MAKFIEKYIIRPVHDRIEKTWEWFWSSEKAIVIMFTVILPAAGIATAGPNGPPFSQLLSIIAPFIFIATCIYITVLLLAVIYALLS